MPKVSEILNVLDQENRQAQAKIQQLQQDLDQQLMNLRQSLLVSVNSADRDNRRDMEIFCSQLRTSIDQLNPAMEEILNQRIEVYRKTVEKVFTKETARIQQQYQKGQASFLAEARNTFHHGMKNLSIFALIVIAGIVIYGWVLKEMVSIRSFPHQKQDGLMYVQGILGPDKKLIFFTDPASGKYWVAAHTEADFPETPNKPNQ